MLCTPFYPMVLLIIIPFLNGYFIGNIPYFQTNPYWRMDFLICKFWWFGDDPHVCPRICHPAFQMIRSNLLMPVGWVQHGQTILDILFKTHPKQRGWGDPKPHQNRVCSQQDPGCSLDVHICQGSCTYPHDVNVVWVGKTHWRHITVTVPQGEIARALTLVFLLTVLTCFDVWAGYEYAKGLGASSWITGSIALALQMSLLTLPFSSHLASGSQKPCEFWSSKPNTSGHLAVVAEKYTV